MSAKLIAEGYSVIVLNRRPDAAVAAVAGAADYLVWEPGVLGQWASRSTGRWRWSIWPGAPFFRRCSRGDFDRVVTGGCILGNRCLCAAIMAAAERPAVFLSASAVGFYGFTGVAEPDEMVTE